MQHLTPGTSCHTPPPAAVSLTASLCLRLSTSAAYQRTRPLRSAERRQPGQDIMPLSVLSPSHHSLLTL